MDTTVTFLKRNIHGVFTGNRMSDYQRRRSAIGWQAVEVANRVRKNSANNELQGLSRVQSVGPEGLDVVNE